MPASIGARRPRCGVSISHLLNGIIRHDSFQCGNVWIIRPLKLDGVAAVVEFAGPWTEQQGVGGDVVFGNEGRLQCCEEIWIEPDDQGALAGGENDARRKIKI